MTDLLVDAFEMFDRRIQPTNAQMHLAMGRGHRLSRILDRSPQISECRLVGSIVRSTAVRIFSDVDVLAVFDLPRSPEMDDSRKLLVLAQSIIEDHARTFTSNENTVSLRFAKWPNVDVLPAVASNGSANDRKLWIPAGSGEWRFYCPGSDDQLVASAVSRFGEGFKSVVRIFKWWNKSNGGIIHSVEVERLARKAFTQGLPAWPQAILALFMAIAPEQDGVSACDLRSADMVISSESTDIVRRGCDLAVRAQQAAAIADFRGASVLWRRLLGDRFPVVGG